MDVCTLNGKKVEKIQLFGGLKLRTDFFPFQMIHVLAKNKTQRKNPTSNACYVKLYAQFYARIHSNNVQFRK